MINPEYFRQQAAICLRLAAAVRDKDVGRALVRMADDFSDKADEIDPSLPTCRRNLGTTGNPA
jgi:hypothetical protein